MEVKFYDCQNIEDQIQQVDENFGVKRNLLIMDNNILCSPHLEQIVNDIISLGFDGSPNFIRPNVFSSLMRKIERRVNMQVDYYHLIEKAISEIRNFSKRIARYLNVINEYTVHVNEILEAEEDNLAGYYPEMDQLRGKCRYDDCRHVSEPECAVRDAVKNGKIHKKRYDSYLANLDEIRTRRKY